MARMLLPVHVASAVGLLGADLALFVLGLGALTGTPASQAYPAMSLVAGWLLLPLALVALATGVALAKVTGHGFRPAWVATKLTITSLLAVVLVAFLLPRLGAAADTATGGGAADPAPGLAIAPAVSALLLTVNVLLATAKPARYRRMPGSPARAWRSSSSSAARADSAVAGSRSGNPLARNSSSSSRSTVAPSADTNRSR
jgi:hypothetical protein